MLSTLIAATAAGADERPNIVVIMTDDAGYSDPGSYGGEIPTPNIDRLAADGVRFAKFYTNARCSPTRASLLTGMYPHRVGVGALAGPAHETPFPGYKGNMSKDAVTVAEALRATGYHTLMSGKWHLGGERQADADRRPRSRGFDRFFGLIGGEKSYFEHGAYFLDDAPYARGSLEYGDSFYATRAITDYAIRFMRQARAKDRRPFFLYVPYTAPHKPHHVPETDKDRFKELYREGVWETVRKARDASLRRQGLIDDKWVYKPLAAEDQKRFDGRGWAIGQMALIAAMSNLVDQGVGQIVEAIEELGELDNTLIVYLSDNGPDGFHSRVGAAPLTGAKRFLTEGGIATHCILHWPAGIRKPGRIERRPGHVIDLMPTFLELAGSTREPNPRRDGLSLVPVIRDKRFKGHGMLFWELYGQQAVIDNNRWKYLLDTEGDTRLYDLRSDPAETVDLATSRPRKLRRLAARYQRWADANNVVSQDEIQAWRQAQKAAKLEQRQQEKKKNQRRKKKRKKAEGVGLP